MKKNNEISTSELISRRKAAMIASFVFLGCAVVGISLILLIFIFKNCLTCQFINYLKDCLEYIYYISAISATCAFGLSAIQFSIKNEIEELSKKIINEIKSTNEGLADLEKIFSSDDYLFVTNLFNYVCSYYNLDKTIDEYYNHVNETDDSKSILVVGNQYNKELLAGKMPINQYIGELVEKNFYIIECEKPSPIWISNPEHNNISFIYFVKKLNKILCDLEPICYKYVNKTMSRQVFESESCGMLKKLYAQTSLLSYIGVIDGQMPNLRIAILIFLNKM